MLPFLQQCCGPVGFAFFLDLWSESTIFLILEKSGCGSDHTNSAKPIKKSLYRDKSSSYFILNLFVFILVFEKENIWNCSKYKGKNSYPWDVFMQIVVLILSHGLMMTCNLDYLRYRTTLNHTLMSQFCKSVICK